MTLPRGREIGLLAAVALVARVATFGNPAVHADEEFYYVVAHAMANGAWPYADVWDRKPVGLFLLYLPPAALPWPIGIWAYQLLALAFAVGTAWLATRLARAAGWSAGATLAGVAYLLWLNLAEGQGGQSPVFYNLLMAGAALLICRRGATHAWRGIAAMALVGWALQVKYSVVFEGLFFGLWIVAAYWQAHRRAGATLALGMALIAVAMLPTMLAGAVSALAGHGDAWWYANFHSILQRRHEPMADQLANLATLALILSPLLAMAGVTAVRLRWTDTRVFLFGWAAAAVGGMLLFGAWFVHYGLPVILPLAVCAAGAIGEHRDVRRWAMPVLALVAIGGQVLVVSKMLRRSTRTQYAAVDAAIGRGPGCLWVYSGDPMFYASSGRCAATRFLFPSHLGLDREQGAIGTDSAEEIRRIFARRPGAIVVRPPYKGERGDVRALVLAGLARAYRETAAVRQGRLLTRVFKPR